MCVCVCEREFLRTVHGPALIARSIYLRLMLLPLTFSFTYTLLHHRTGRLRHERDGRSAYSGCQCGVSAGVCCFCLVWSAFALGACLVLV